MIRKATSKDIDAIVTIYNKVLLSGKTFQEKIN